MQDSFLCRPMAELDCLKTNLNHSWLLVLGCSSSPLARRSLFCHNSRLLTDTECYYDTSGFLGNKTFGCFPPPPALTAWSNEESVHPRWSNHSGCLHQVKTRLKLTKFLAVSENKIVEFLIKHSNLWLENVFQSAVVVGISLLKKPQYTALSQTEVTVNGQEEQQMADGQLEHKRRQCT